MVSVFTYPDVNTQEVGRNEISVGNHDAKLILHFFNQESMKICRTSSTTYYLRRKRVHYFKNCVIRA